MRRNRCIRLQVRASISGCATRTSWLRNCFAHRARKRATLRNCSRYAASRRVDRASAIAFTRTLLAVFGNDSRRVAFAARVGAHFARRASHQRSAHSRARCCSAGTENDSRERAVTCAQRLGIIRSLLALPQHKNRTRIVQIGPHIIANNLVVAPMAGVTDRPFRQLCKRLGRGLAVSEMVASQSRCCGAPRKRTAARITRAKSSPSSVQIAGADPAMMADAARYNVDRGAQIIDINMGCPAKKVCNVMAGSALLQDEPLVASILEAVVARGRRAGHAQDPHGLGPGEPQCRAHRAASREDAGIAGAGGARPHARCAFVGRSRIRHDRRSEARGRRFR